MTIQMLSNYRIICAEIYRLEKKLNDEKFHVVDTVQSAAEFPYWLHEVPIEGDVWDYDTKPIRERILRRKQQKTEIERYVQGINKYLVQRAVEVKYMEPASDPVKWDDVAAIIGYNGSGNALKQLVWQFVVKNP